MLKLNPNEICTDAYIVFLPRGILDGNFLVHIREFVLASLSPDVPQGVVIEGHQGFVSLTMLCCHLARYQLQKILQD